MSRTEKNALQLASRVQTRDLLAVNAPTQIDKLRASIAPAVNVLPPNSLPRWKDYPLEKKFPKVPANDDKFSFARNAIGESVYVSSPRLKFDNDDPRMAATPKGYSALHDPNLKDYFAKHPKVFQRLVEHGLVDPEDGGVRTEMKEFNEYRAYLGRLRNSLVDTQLHNGDDLDKAQIAQLRKIRRDDKRLARKKRVDAKNAVLDKMRKEERARELFKQLKEGKLASTVAADEKARDAAAQALRRELVREKVRERLAKMRRAERRRARRILLEWYCRQLYADMLRNAIAKHKKKVRRADLESFVEAKRDHQNKMLKYEKALREKRGAERECHVNARRAKYESLEAHRLDNLKARAMEAEIKAQRELYLTKKFGRRWLNFVRQQKDYAKTYHDSVWHVRQQLIGMVKDLKKESGKVSFTNFIQGLVGLKPGRQAMPKMSEETRDVMNYILDQLIQSAFDTYNSQHAPCKHAYEDQSRRRKILGKPDRKPEEFLPPPVNLRDKPNIPFERPTFPCKHPCTALHPRYKEDPDCCEDEECEDEDEFAEAADMVDEELRRAMRAATPRERSAIKKALEKKQPDGSTDSSAVAEGAVDLAISRSLGHIGRKPRDERPTSKGSEKKLLERGREEEQETAPEPAKVAQTKKPVKEEESVGPEVERGEPPPESSNSSAVAESATKFAIQKSVSELLETPKEKEELVVPEETASTDGSSVVAEKLVAKSITNVASGLGVGDEEEAEEEEEEEGEGDGPPALEEIIMPELETMSGDEGKGAGEEMTTDDGTSEASSAVAEKIVTKSLTKVASSEGTRQPEKKRSSQDRKTGDDGALKSRDDDVDKATGQPTEEVDTSEGRPEDIGAGERIGDILEQMEDARKSETALTEETGEEKPPVSVESEVMEAVSTGKEEEKRPDDVWKDESRPPSSIVSEILPSAVSEESCSSGSSGSDLAMRVVNESLRRAVDALRCKDTDDNKPQEEPCSSSTDSQSTASRIVEESVRKAIQTICGPAGPLGSGSRAALKRLSSTACASDSESVSSADAEDVVKRAIAKAVKGLECTEEDLAGLGPLSSGGMKGSQRGGADDSRGSELERAARGGDSGGRGSAAGVDGSRYGGGGLGAGGFGSGGQGPGMMSGVGDPSRWTGDAGIPRDMLGPSQYSPGERGATTQGQEALIGSEGYPGFRSNDASNLEQRPGGGAGLDGDGTRRQGPQAQRSCESVLDEMAKAVVASVLPSSPVSSSYFTDMPPSRPTNQAPVFPLGAQQPEETRSAMPADLRDNVLRTLSNVQGQLNAIRHELQNYGVIPPDNNT